MIKKTYKSSFTLYLLTFFDFYNKQKFENVLKVTDCNLKSK